MRTHQTAAVKYGYAVVAVAIALGVALALQAFDLEGFLFVIAVAVAVWFGGRGPGVLAILLSMAVLHYVFIAPFETGSRFHNLGYFIVFAVLTVLITVLTEMRRQIDHSLTQTRDELETKVRERTAELRRSEMLLAGEKELLEMIAAGFARDDILHAACRLYETLDRGSLSSILIFDPEARSLRHGAAPSLPPEYTQAIDGIVIGPSVGSCGTAAYWAKPAIVADIATDPLWADYRDLALAHGLRACWSSPILSSDGQVLGTFATYYREPRRPQPPEVNLIEQIIHLAGIAIEREMDTTATRRAEAALREQANLLNLTHDSIFVRDVNDVITYWNRGAEELYGWTAVQAVGRISHDLTRTVFPAPIDEINAELLRAGRWEGELVHTKADGTHVVVASRWALQLDAQGRPRAILETNNDITASKRAEHALEDLAGRLIIAQEDERSRIGRELHDHVSQTLTVLTIKIDRLHAHTEVTPGIRASLQELRSDTSEIAGDVHRLSHRLHSGTLDHLGLVPALQKLVAEFSERHDIAISFAHQSLPPSLPSDVALCLFRVAEESLTNIAKHSQARSAAIHVTGSTEGIHLKVQDAGTGFDMAALGTRAGLGFVSMQERLRALRGRIHVDSAPSKGTRIEAWVPASDRIVMQQAPN